MRNLKISVLLAVLALSGACATVREAGGQSANGTNANGTNASNAAAKSGGAVIVPGGMKNASRDSETAMQNAPVVTLANKTDILYRTETQKLSVDELGKKLDEYNRAAETGAKGARVVYIISDAGNEFGAVIRILELARRKRFDTARLVVNRNEKDAPPDIFSVMLAAARRDDVVVKPNPNFLLATLLTDGMYKLNAEGKTLDELKRALTEIFKYREENLVLREGTNEVDKTVRINAPLSAKYEDVVRMIDTVKEAGAVPIVIQIDELEK